MKESIAVDIMLNESRFNAFNSWLEYSRDFSKVEKLLRDIKKISEFNRRNNKVLIDFDILSIIVSEEISSFGILVNKIVTIPNKDLKHIDLNLNLESDAKISAVEVQNMLDSRYTVSLKEFTRENVDYICDLGKDIVCKIHKALSNGSLLLNERTKLNMIKEANKYV